MNVIIISDLHIGSEYFLSKDFEGFIENLSEGDELVLNGDIINNPRKKLAPRHQRMMDLIEQLSYRQRVVWVRGNHDNGYSGRQLGKVSFKRHFNIGRRLMIAHGDFFDEIMPKCLIFMRVFKFMHDLRVKLGARPVHVAHYAKKWPLLYNLLRKNVMVNAVNYAIENGYEAVACGHTHFPEDREFKGVRYLNTGTWTEKPIYCIQVTSNQITMKMIEDSNEYR